MTIIVMLLLAATVPIADARWLRVAQREHYLPGTVSTFALRWWTLNRRNTALLALAVAGAIASAFVGWAAIVALEVAAIGPLGLSMRGRTSRLAWTRRLKLLAIVHLLIVLVVVGIGVALGIGSVVAAVTALTLPLTLDAALLAVLPIERRAAKKFVDQARTRLDRVGPTRVAITGSYGKTTIKGYVRQLTETTRSVVASPASFNNTGGLSRAVNEHLGPDTEVFIAEMGTYGPGEIRQLCTWVKPNVSALCNIGPVHLERFGTVDTIVTSKSEIFDTSSVAVLNIDAYGLAAAADKVETTGQRVIRCSATPGSGANVVVTIAAKTNSGPATATVTIDGIEHRAEVAPSAIAENVAVAVGLALALDVAPATIMGRLATLPVADHRQEVSATPTGVSVVDNTYNSNPAGAASALATLVDLPAKRRALVTPGMVELGPEQAIENERFAAAASTVVDDILIVGYTNRAALLRGAAAGSATVQLVKTRNEAVEWIKRHLDAGDAVLYENDLPDHYA